MEVVILCGGLGTRLQSVVADRPKALAEVAGKPFLTYVLTRLARAGFAQFILSAGYKADQIQAFAAAFLPELAQIQPDARLQVVTEPSPLGTGGAFRYVVQTCGLDAPFMAMNGDTFFDGDPQALIHAWEQQQADAVVAVTQVMDAARYGRVSFDENCLVTKFEEKRTDLSPPIWINAGVYILSPRIFTPFSEAAFSLEQKVFPRLVQEKRLCAHPFEAATFLDIGTPADYARAVDFLT